MVWMGGRSRYGELYRLPSLSKVSSDERPLPHYIIGGGLFFTQREKVW
jgi:hypothetical protein